jgi:Glyoxalase-like domain
VHADGRAQRHGRGTRKSKSVAQPSCWQTSVRTWVFGSPQSIGGTGVSLHLYVNDVDACFNRAVAAGAKSLRPVQDQFYGDRSGTLEDPFGHVWTISTHKEDLSHEELCKRAEAAMKQHGGHS